MTINTSLPSIRVNQRTVRTAKKAALIAGVGIVPYALFKAGEALYRAITSDDDTPDAAPTVPAE